MVKSDPFGTDFDPMADDDFGAAKPKPKKSAAVDPMEVDIGEQGIGFTPEKAGGGSFWGKKSTASAAAVAQPQRPAPMAAPEKKPDTGYDLDGASGVGAPTQNAFKRKKEAVKLDTEASERERLRASATAIFGEAGKDAPNIPLDTPVSNGYWGAMFALTCMRDVEVVVDAPVGCYSLPATATINYTDALPEIENLASSNITEIEVTLDGTTRKVLNAVKRVKEREAKAGHKKHLVVVSSQESELIGADHVMSLQRKHPDAMYFTSHSFEIDEWKSRDETLLWLYQERKKRQEAAGEAKKLRTKSRAVNIIGPTYSCFNSYADLHELKRLVQGAGGELHFVYPFEAYYSEMDKLDESAVNIVMYREFGTSLAQALGKPYLYAPFGMQETTDFILELGRLLGTDDIAEEFVRTEKRDTLLPIWDIWLGAPQDFYNTTKIAIIANESYALGLQKFLGEELGMDIGTVVNRQKSNDTNNYILRNRLQAERPTILMGSMNERIYLVEAGLTTKFMAAALPVPLITRSVGTPYMGYRGAVYVMQTITNMLFDVLFDILPREKRDATGLPGGPTGTATGTPMVAARNTAASPNANQNQKFSEKLDELSALKWSNEAKATFDQIIDKVPWIAKISASDKLRAASVAEARAQDRSEVGVDIVMKVLPQIMQ